MGNQTDRLQNDDSKTKGETILLTGSSGLIGSALAERLVKDFHVVGFDTGRPPYPPPGVECVKMDLTSDESVKRSLGLVRERHGEIIASVVHLAAYYSFSGKPSPKYESVTVRGTERLLRELRSFDVRQFIFSSTMLVHAPSRPGCKIREDSPLTPGWDYPRSKIRTEELIRAQRGDIPAVILRISGVYDDFCHSIPLAHQIQRIYERKLIGHFFPGDMSRGQSFMHLHDLVEALHSAIKARGELPPETILLLGEPEVMPYGEIQKELGRLLHGREWLTLRIPKKLAKLGAWLQDSVPFGPEPFIKPWMIDFSDQHYDLDISKAQSLLNWKPRRNLKRELGKTVEILKENPRRWYHENDLTGPGAES